MYQKVSIYTIDNPTLIAFKSTQFSSIRASQISVQKVICYGHIQSLFVQHTCLVDKNFLFFFTNRKFVVLTGERNDRRRSKKEREREKRLLLIMSC